MFGDPRKCRQKIALCQSAFHSDKLQRNTFLTEKVGHNVHILHFYTTSQIFSLSCNLAPEKTVGVDVSLLSLSWK